MAQPNAEQARPDALFIVAEGTLWACRACGSVVDGRLSGTHERWHRDEVQRVAAAQQRNALVARFPTRRGL